MIAPTRWLWALFASIVDLLRTTGRLLTTGWGIAFAVLAVAIILAQVVAK